MLISGYFSYSSIQKKSFIPLMKQKFQNLIIPIIAWVSLVYLIKFFIRIVNNTLSLMFIKEYLSTIVHSFWFLWVLFGCYFIISFGKNYIKKGFNCYLIVTFILLLILPDKLNLKYLKFMYPYFVLGYFWRMKYNSFFKISKLQQSILSIIFIALYIFWRKDYYIYTTGMNLRATQEMPLIITYRYLSGLVGSLVYINVMYNLKSINNLNLISKLGQYTLAIYILQTYIMQFILMLSIQFDNMILYTFIITPILAFITTFLCVMFFKWATTFSLFKKYFFGQ